jgi:hypothetical protein
MFHLYPNIYIIYFHKHNKRHRETFVPRFRHTTFVQSQTHTFSLAALIKHLISTLIDHRMNSGS